MQRYKCIRNSYNITTYFATFNSKMHQICKTIKSFCYSFYTYTAILRPTHATGQKLSVEYRVTAPDVTVTFGVEPDALTQGQTMYAG